MIDIQVTLEFAGLSDTGKVRSGNEDAIVLAPALRAAILADGMGGYNAGEVASGMACALLKNELESDAPPPDKPHETPLHQRLQEAIARTNNAIFQLAQSQNQYSGMGTTLVLTVFNGAEMTVAHLGDSRMYRLRNKHLEQITSDHSVLQAQIDAGILTPEQAKLSQNKNLVTRALGIEAEVQPEIHTIPSAVGDVYLLCSDGLSDMVEDDEIQAILLNYGHELQLCANQLIASANQNGGRDNVSAILIRVVDLQQTRLSPMARFLKWLK
jgi:protein phosphatase